MYMYVSTTWLVANLIHPIMLFIVFGNASINSETLGIGLAFIFYSILLSLPSLLISYVFMYVLSRLDMPPQAWYFTWLILAPVIVVVNYWLIFHSFLGEEMSRENIQIMLPAMFSVVLTILARYNSFFRKTDQSKNKRNERSMV